MFYYLFDLALVFFEVFCCKMFFETFTQKEHAKKNPYSILGLIAFIYISLFIDILYHFFLLKQTVLVITITLFMSWYFEIGKKKSFLLATLYECLLLVVDYFAYAAKNTLFSSDEEVWEQYAMEGILLVALGKVLLFLCVLIIKKVFRDPGLWELTDTEWIRFLFFPIFSIITITVMIVNFKYVENESQAQVLFCIAFGLTGSNIFIFYLLKDILKREKQLHEKELYDTEVRNKSEMYHSLAENHEQQKRKAHEFKNQIMCIQALLKNQNYKELDEYVAHVNGKMEKENNVIDTNHVIVNAILNSKYKEALKKQILFIPKVNDLGQLPFDESDLIIILSNLLNNAIEACEKIKGEKIIKMKFIREETQIILSVQNTYNGTIFDTSGEFQTTKIYKAAEHGLGLKNIISQIEKYSGSYVINYDEKEFLFSILIPLSPPS